MFLLHIDLSHHKLRSLRLGIRLRAGLGIFVSPVGSVRANWSSEALKEKDPEIEKAEDLYRNEVIEDCKRLIVRFDKLK